VKNSLLAVSKTNPATWWLLGLGFAVCASLSKNQIVLLIVSAISMFFVWLFREESSWSKSITFYLRLALIVIFIRIIFRIIFNLEVDPINPLISLPAISFDLGNGISFHLLGSMSGLSFNAALTDGLRLSAIILSVGMASSLANPRKLLKATPGALYEVATAISIALNLAPQLISSINRVRRARSLRGQSKGIRAIPGIVIPVLEDTIDQSMSLAASMSARGFGRRGTQTKSQQRLARFIGLLAVACLAIGTFLLLVSPEDLQVDLLIIIFGLLSAFLYIRLSSLGQTRTKYTKQPWRIGDFIWLGLISVALASFVSGVIL